MVQKSKSTKKKLTMVLKLAVFGAFSLSLTLFMFLSSYELLFNKDIKYVKAINSVGTLKSEQIITPLIPKIYPDNVALGTYGKPHELRFPTEEFRMSIVPYIKNDGHYLFRANNAHFLPTSEAKQGGLGDSVIYLSRDWRTINDPNSIKVDDNVFIDTDKGWRYMYRLIEKKVLSYDGKYVASERQKSSLIILIEDHSSDRIYVYEAELVSLQNVDR